MQTTEYTLTLDNGNELHFYAEPYSCDGYQLRAEEWDAEARKWVTRFDSRLVGYSVYGGLVYALEAITGDDYPHELLDRLRLARAA